jgi:hypothetical protein
MTLFRDDMLDVRRARASEYYTADNGNGEGNLGDDYELDIVAYRAAAAVIVDRLDLMGVTTSATLAFLGEQLNDRRGGVPPNDSDSELLDAVQADAYRKNLAAMKSKERARSEYARKLRNSLDSSRWLDLLKSAPEGRSFDTSQKLGSNVYPSQEPGSQSWLLEQLDSDEDNWAERYVLRAVLMAFPGAEVILDLTELELSGYLGSDGLQSMASDSAESIRRAAAVGAPVVVLTEGRTDAEFLTAGLKILYPHLTDLIRFLDYDFRPEGGVGALVHLVRAFTAAGIVNCVVAVFDNDTAAADGLKNSKLASSLSTFE